MDNLREGDVVLIIDESSPREHWPMGKVVGSLPGPHGIVRATLVKTSKGEYVRPVSKLCHLNFVSPDSV